MAVIIPIDSHRAYRSIGSGFAANFCLPSLCDISSDPDDEAMEIAPPRPAA